jgi:hypothetical protein
MSTQAVSKLVVRIQVRRTERKLKEARFIIANDAYFMEYLGRKQ